MRGEGLLTSDNDALLRGAALLLSLCVDTLLSVHHLLATLHSALRSGGTGRKSLLHSRLTNTSRGDSLRNLAVLSRWSASRSGSGSSASLKVESK